MQEPGQEPGQSLPHRRWPCQTQPLITLWIITVFVKTATSTQSHQGCLPVPQQHARVAWNQLPPGLAEFTSGSFHRNASESIVCLFVCFLFLTNDMTGAASRDLERDQLKHCFFAFSCTIPLKIKKEWSVQANKQNYLESLHHLFSCKLYLSWKLKTLFTAHKFWWPQVSQTHFLMVGRSWHINIWNNKSTQVFKSDKEVF